MISPASAPLPAAVPIAYVVEDVGAGPTSARSGEFVVAEGLLQDLEEILLVELALVRRAEPLDLTLQAWSTAGAVLGNIAGKRVRGLQPKIEVRATPSRGRSVTGSVTRVEMTDRHGGRVGSVSA